eukprot:COSAG01_NODE_5693_length_4093_cov_19.586880_4_plen_163_part_00
MPTSVATSRERGETCRQRPLSILSNVMTRSSSPAERVGVAASQPPLPVISPLMTSQIYSTVSAAGRHAAQNVSAAGCGDNAIDHHKELTELPPIPHFCDPIISTCTRPRSPCVRGVQSREPARGAARASCRSSARPRLPWCTELAVCAGRSSSRRSRPDSSA